MQLVHVQVPITVLLLLAGCLTVKAADFVYYNTQNQVSVVDSGITNAEPDSINGPDSTKTDTFQSITLPISPDTLEAQVKYKASDSAILKVIESKFYLYGEAEVKYQEIQLKAAKIVFDWNKNTVHAYGVEDSTGKLIGKPQFSDGDKSFEAREMAYNFKSKKGKIYDLMTQESEGYLHTREAKKLENNAIYARRVQYTTCNLEHPHFYVEANPAKVIPNELLVAGPANLVIAGVRTPFVLPFALFPLKREQRQSGLILPQVANTGNFGYGLTNGGYYFALSDYYDLALTGDIYSSGSYGVRGNTSFKKRYKYSGNLNINYARYKTGSALFETLNINNTFKVNSSFRIDPKAWPNNEFSMNLNFGTSNYNRFNETESLDQRLNNTYSSSINYSHDFPESLPLRFNAKARYFQSIKSREITLTLPEVFLGTQTIFPFEKKGRIGDKKWYEQINFSWRMNAQNSVRTTDSTFLTQRTIEQMQLGVSHSLPVSANFKVLKYFNISPGISYNEDWYIRSYDYRYEPTLEGDSTFSYVQIDTSRGFKAVRYYSFSTALQTNLYGFLRFKNSKIKAIRHKITPSISFNYNPNFAEPRFDYYQTVRINPEGDEQVRQTFPSLYGSPSRSEFGGISYRFQNSIEMKVEDAKDTVDGTKKVSLFDNLNINGSYNFVADSLQWSQINVNGYSNLFNRKVRVNYGARFDPYALNETGQRIDKFYWDETGKPLRFESANVTMSTGFDGNEISFIDFPFNFGMDYSLTLNKGAFGRPDTVAVTQAVGANLSLDPTSNWTMRIDVRYDIVNRDLVGLTLDLRRDLHCWYMSFNWIPTGFAKRYSFTIQANSSMLESLRLRKQSDPYANFPEFQ